MGFQKVTRRKDVRVLPLQVTPKVRGQDEGLGLRMRGQGSG
jgi:hypothetical protein